MSTKTPMPKDHGLLSPAAQAKAAVPLVPRALRTATLYFGIPTAEAIAKYGRWSLRMLKENYVAGTFIKAGETFVVPGNLAVDLVVGGWSEFVNQDEIQKEEAALKTLEALNKAKVDRRAMPEFARE